MASQYSILRNYGKYVSPYNMDVMMQGMGYMQQKIRWTVCLIILGMEKMSFGDAKP